jgi:nitrite reductase (NADH) large subunit
LYERLLYSLEGLPDPWAARIGGMQKHEYIPLKVVA